MKLIHSAPALVPGDLGIELEEDSPDLTDEEVAGAVNTDNPGEFASKLIEFSKENGAPGAMEHELRRRAGIHYSRVGIENGPKRVFRIEWIRSGS